MVLTERDPDAVPVDPTAEDDPLEEARRHPPRLLPDPDALRPARLADEDEGAAVDPTDRGA